MIYVGTPPRLNDYGYRDKCRAYIDPSLNVARKGADTRGHQLPYWPGYSEISAASRLAYLDWLASGRSDTSYDLGYMFLYFYGLERRFFVDHPTNEEKKEILEEVKRLKVLYPSNGSAQRYLGEFIQVAEVTLGGVESLEPVFDYRGWELPLSLRLAIGIKLENGEQLSANWVLSWFMCHPERQLRTPATRCGKEFKALFEIRFDGRFPDGLKVRKPRKTLQTSYRAASSEFEVTVEPKIGGSLVPDISGVRKPVEIAQEIADGAMEDLDKLSRYLGKNEDGRGSIEAQALLPRELWDRFPSEELEDLKSWAADIVSSGGPVPTIDVIERLEGARPDKIGKRNLTGAADALARVGYGVAPDPRFALRSPKIDEPVVLFELDAPIEQLEDVSEEYRATLFEIALGSFVVHADGQVTESERQSLRAKAMDAKALSDQERRRLNANLEWMLAVPPDMTLLRRKLKDAGEDAQSAIRASLVMAAHADGIIQSEEVAAIEKVYNALGLDPALVYSDLHSGNIGDGPVRVRAAVSARKGESIPVEETRSTPRLDAARIAEIQSDTARVSTVLGEIFDESTDTTNEASIRHSHLPGLDDRHAILVEQLVQEDHWTEDALEELCKASGLLASGAIETINEWAFEHYDEALLEEYDGYDVSSEVAGAVQSAFRREEAHV